VTQNFSWRAREMFRALKIQGKKEVTKMGKIAVIKSGGAFDGRVIEIIPQGYLEKPYVMVEDKSTRIQFPIRQEHLLPL